MFNSIDDAARQIRTGDRRALARAITLVESTRHDHRSQADQLLSALATAITATPSSNDDKRASLRIGITGTPGVGKSTFIEAFGLHLCNAGHRVAVLAVDPSSTRTGGSILGDKTRMEQLSRHPNAFIRPSPSSGTLGGVARRTREVMQLVEAAGFDVVIVETVGVGQSETAVAKLTDAFVLLVAPGGGDELQGVKRGIMELADIIVVNKCDGNLEPAARSTHADYAAALRLIRPGSSWIPRALSASALTGRGIDEVWATINELRAQRMDSGEFDERRAVQRGDALWDEVQDRLTQFRNDQRVEAIEADVREGRLSPAHAANAVLFLLQEP